MVQEMASLGFQHVELSHGIRIPLVPGILRAVDEGLVTITSTHNFCPLPTGIDRAAPNLFQPSAVGRQELKQWQIHTRRSLDFAARVKARVLVCHLGRVEFLWFHPARAVDRYLRDHPGAGRNPADLRFRAVLAKSVARLRHRLPPFWARVRASVAEIIAYAAEKGVKLGFENRERFEELPLDSDFASWLGEFAPGVPVGYWHDTGHADIKETMGLVDHQNQLRTLAPHTLGFHLHDVGDNGRDHQAIGQGHIDFKMVSQFWRPEHLLTIELSPRVSYEEVQTSKRRLESLIPQFPT